MKWTGLNELREIYLEYFKEKGHLCLPSFPLVPINDKSLFLINSGMAPMKKYFLGDETPPSKRVTTCQKCIRTPDIENVGKTSRHGTYFEMLGNFSFGDYFKIEATQYAWDFCTKRLNLPIDKLWVSIYEEDDETFDIWVNIVGVSKEKIVRLGKADNFWEHGSGPCGPCSEIYFDRGEDKGCRSKDCAVGCDCDRYVEFWNLVFSQFDNDGNGNYSKLEKPNIDTGMGLERLACILQGVDNLFEVDTIKNIMQHISDITGVKYKTNENTDISLRVITDHIRSTTFMIADGVIPSNEGRGYVLRRLLRRAARHGRLLGVEKPFLSDVVDTVVNENKLYYKELDEKLSYIKKMVKSEEENFAKTVGKGIELLNNIIEKIIEDDKSDNILSGDDAFKLYDTFGFPIDLTKEIVFEKNISVDEESFKILMNEQKDRARTARGDGEAFGSASYLQGLEDKTTIFTGYDNLSTTANIIAIFHGTESVSSAKFQQKIVIVTDKTPFYPEGGGQASDFGEIVTDNCKLLVSHVQKSLIGNVILHYCSVEHGNLSNNDIVTMNVDVNNRNNTMRNHTAAHLLQASLISILGNHVHQAGQLVNGSSMRFDFTHFEALTKDEIKQVENLVNSTILNGIDVLNYETDIETARSKGAMALFGEKYGNIVRVLQIGDFSIELCGGTHVDNSAKLGLFKIMSEVSVASGVRRIEAVTGRGVLDLISNINDVLIKTSDNLKSSSINEVSNKALQLMNELKEKNSEIDIMTQKMADIRIEGIFENMESVEGINYMTALLSGTKTQTLRAIGDRIREKAPNSVALLVGSSNDKYTMICVCGKEAIEKGANAGKIVCRAAAFTGGKGGGKLDIAMAGVNDKHKIDEVFTQMPFIIKDLIK